MESLFAKKSFYFGAKLPIDERPKVTLAAEQPHISVRNWISGLHICHHDLAFFA